MNSKDKFCVIMIYFFSSVSHVWATQCSAGMYMPPGFSSYNDCRNCWQGTYSDSGASTCYYCPTGKASVRGDGYSALIAAPCTDCVAGTYTSSVGATSCSSCADGYKSASGDKSCTPSLNDTNVVNNVSTSKKAVDVHNTVSTSNKVVDVDDALNRYFEALNVDQFLTSRAPGLFACAVIGLVGAVLNSLAILVLFLWVRDLKSVATQTDADAV